MRGAWLCRKIKSLLPLAPFHLGLALLALGIIILYTPMALAAQVTLAWDANSESDLAGYKLYYKTGSSGPPYNGTGAAEGSSPITLPMGGLGDPQNPRVTVTGLSDAATYFFVVTAYDTDGNESGYSNEVSYSAQGNQAPAANAGADQTAAEGATVTLDGSGSTDPDGSIASYLWSQTSGPSVALSSTTAAQPSFTAPDVDAGGASLTFQLTVTDDGGLQDSDSCVVHVTSAGVPLTLSGLSITGAGSVNESSSASYTATASFSDGSSTTVTASASWSENSAYATISKGALTTSEVTGDQTVTVTASYTYGGVTKTATKAVTIVDVPASNLPPSKPIIASPYYGETECDLLLNITTEPFSDPDGDSQSKSRWQISEKEDFSSLVLDILSNKHLTELPVPHLVLKEDTSYYVRVRFYDVYSTASEWSDPVRFSTVATLQKFDSNGIRNAQEVDSNVDLNQDGIADKEQPGVIKCVHSASGPYNLRTVRSAAAEVNMGVCKVSAPISAIEAIEFIDPSTISDNTNRPADLLVGLLCYRLRVSQPGATVRVKIYYSCDISGAKSFYKYDRINGWQEYSQYVTLNSDGRSITLEVQDGGHGDADGTANGIIVDPVGINGGESTGSGSGATGSDTGSGGGGCFIATAGFGSYVEPHVKLLRDFRDRCLLTNAPGKWFVRVYYHYGPFAAAYIRDNPWLKPVVRVLLLPLIGISYLLLKASGAAKILAALLLLAPFSCWIHRRRRLRARR